jgi:TRAP-type C4-dicarboxylate transport system substrate-binding protein
MKRKSMKQFRTGVWGTVVLIAALLPAGVVAQKSYTIKFATVAPEGSTWMKVMREFDQTLQQESNGRLKFRIYPGGVQGKEQDVLRKIAIGQIHSAGFTGVGMGDIAPSVRILDTPFLFRSRDEVDHVLEVFTPEFEKAFADGGYVLLGWAEVGFVHVFTNTKIAHPADLKSLKLWTWEGDPVAQAAFQALDLNPIPLSLENVLTSLQTGLLDSYYTSPYAALVLQWYTRSKYMVNVPLANASGAVLLSKKFYDTLPGDLQDILMRTSRTAFRKLTELSREENTQAIQEFRKRGMEFIDATDKDLKIYVDAGAAARRSLAGRLYSVDLMTRVEKELDVYRKAKPSSK